MPSPFPGMDPYLERPGVWPDVHHTLITGLRAAINAALPPAYFARIEDRVYIEETSSNFIPDVSIVRSDSSAPARSGSTSVVLKRSDAPRLLVIDELEIREPYLEIVSASDQTKVITAIEILSLANKQDGRGREEYRRKQREILDSDVSFLEIDLLRGGQHTIAASERQMKREFGHFDYSVCLRRGGTWTVYEIFPLGLRDPLPKLVIPLSKGVPDVRIPLGAVLNRAYDEGRLAFSARYDQPPVPPLSEEDQLWAKEILGQ